MTRNEGNLDRIARAIVGLVLLGLVAGGQIGLWGWIGVVLVATAVLGWCPLYSALGINTCGMR